MKQILLDSCPAKLMFEEPLSNKMEMISRGNSKSFNDNPERVKNAKNEEDRYSHAVPLDILICHLLPYLRHTTQIIIIKEDKNPLLCCDASTTRKPTDIVKILAMRQKGVNVLFGCEVGKHPERGYLDFVEAELSLFVGRVSNGGCWYSGKVVVNHQVKKVLQGDGADELLNSLSKVFSKEKCLARSSINIGSLGKRSFLTASQIQEAILFAIMYTMVYSLCGKTREACCQAATISLL
jgi:hypothetical protein